MLPDDLRAEVEELKKGRQAAQEGQPPEQPQAADEAPETREGVKAKKQALLQDRKADLSDQAEAVTDQPAAEEGRIYVVKKGDSLSKIAQEVYDDASRWREIYKANKDRIEDPSLIRPGWKLRIP